MAVNEIRVDVSNVQTKLNNIKNSKNRLQIKSSNLQISGRSEALSKLLELYGQFGRIVLTYQGLLEQDIQSAVQSVGTIKQIDEEIAGDYLANR